MSARSRRRQASRRIEADRGRARVERYEDVRARIATGDLLFFRGRGPFSRLVRWASGSVYSHVAIAAWWEDRLVVFESRGRGGVKVRPFRRAMEGYRGRIDWWSLRADLAEGLDGSKLVRRALDELGKPYSIRGLFSLAWRILVGRLTGSRDPVSLPEAHFCSQYVSLCFREAGVDLAPDAEDACTSPGAIVRGGAVELRAVLRKRGS